MRGDGWTGVGRGSSLFGALLALAAVVRLGAILNRRLDPDESQHLHAAWLVSQGKVPFVDFWEHHSPLAYYVLAPVTRGFAESPAVYLAARVAMTVAAGLALLLTYRLARRLGRDPARTAVVLLAFLPQFVENSTEVRPDVPALVAWLGALLALVRRREGGGPGWLWLAGLAQGLALTLTLKAAYGVVGLAVAVGLAERRESRVAPVLAGLSRLAGGACVPIVALVGWLGLTGGGAAVVGFVDQAIVQNFDFVDFTKAWPVTGAGLGVALLGLGGIVLAGRAEGRGRILGHAVHGSLLPPLGIVGLGFALPGTPAIYQQAWLPVHPIVAVYAGLALATLLARARAGRERGARVLLGLALAGGLVVPGGESLRDALRDQTAPQFHLMRRLLAEACPGEPVLDGTALAVFRPAAYRYGALITGVRLWIARGAISEERIRDDILEARARVAYPDRRLRALIGPVADLLKDRYVAGPEGLLLAGAAIPAREGGHGGRAAVDLLVSGLYRLSADPRGEVTIDGTRRGPGWLELGAGRHEVRWIGPARPIRLVAASCAERRAASKSLTLRRAED